MAKVVEFVTRLDIDALADDQLAEEREDAVRRHLQTDGGALEDLVKMDMLNAALQALKPAIYRDRALRETVEKLLRRRAA
ncbi:hypothetical protein [Hyphococcus luteus]|uniref:Uncharacterized protein n=1 Tax=Hyphococcus luteus TaxID=2058213 RepID=A0A2S7KA51_9PROT|nr:hypothetical protein [Marinicaulis flavus]PQA89367.1 hypothetical protein CW354_00375 [Marinicaulis flavus]